MGKIIELESYENIPEYTGLKNEEKLELKDDYEWYGQKYGIRIGIIYDDGTVKSSFKKDIDNNNTEIFDRLRNDIKLYTDHVELRNYDTYGLKGATRYYIPYKVKNHCSNKQTITDCYVERCNNVHYSVEYEILLVADEQYKRYITVEYKTDGSHSTSLYDEIKCIEEDFEEWFSEGTNGFKIDEDGIKSVTFYNDIGEHLDIDIESIDDLLDMIMSIKVIKCDSKIIE